jgi:hypothetical protein
MATTTHPLAFDLISTLTTFGPETSWLESIRRQFGLEEQEDADPVLTLSILPADGSPAPRPIALMIEPEQQINILTALGEFVRQTVQHPNSMIVIDYLPALDVLGAAIGSQPRRWVLDKSNAMMQLQTIAHFVRAATL